MEINFTVLSLLAAVIAVIAVGAGVVVAIRKILDSRVPTISRYMAIILSAIVVAVLASAIGVNVSLNYAPILIAAFLGSHLTQHDPWSVRGICAPLATVSGLVALFAAISSNLIAIAVALGVTGVLVHLAQSESTN
jgi:hypothetical protein